MLEQFYRDVLPGSGYYALFSAGTKVHTWFSSIDELVAATEAAKTPDLYFATAAYKSLGTQYGGRTQANVLALQSWRFDIDAGQDKFERGRTKYQTQAAAKQDLVAFSRELQLMPTYVVSSGAGLHVYYCLSGGVDPEHWGPIAERLQQAADTFGLDVDHSVTCDTARVLRPPGTIHGKTGSVVEILANYGARYTIADMDAKLPQLARLAKPKAESKYDMSVNEDLYPSGPPRSVEKILQRCGAMAFAANNQVETSEPHWRAMLGVIKHTVEGISAAHKYSCDHPDYDEAATEEKYERWDTGPTTCNEFARHFPGCHECEYWGKIRSPIVVGEMTPEEVEESPVAQIAIAEVAEAKAEKEPWKEYLPEANRERSYFTRPAPNGVTQLWANVQMPTKNESGELVHMTRPVLVCTFFYLDSWSGSTGDEDSALASLRVPHVGGPVGRFTLRQRDTGTPQALKTFLADKALHVGNDRQSEQLLMDYTRRSLESLRAAQQRPKITERFGMRIDGDKLCCAHGKYMIYPDGTIRIAHVGERVRSMVDWYQIGGLEKQTEEHWSPTAWVSVRAAAVRYQQFVKKYYDYAGMGPFQLAITLGLASPLMAFVTSKYTEGHALPPNSLAVSLYSRGSGRGKTTAIQMAMAAFGNPHELVREGNNTSSTAKGRLSRLTASGTMPVSFDEMGRVPSDELTELISTIANGGGRDRSSRTGQASVSARWASISLMTGNRLQRDILAEESTETAAVQTRLLELDASTIPDLPPELLASFDPEFGMLSDTFGAFGAFVELAMCRRGPTAMNDLLAVKVAEARTLLGQDEQGARFQWRALGAVLALQDLLASMRMELFSTQTLVDEFKKAYEDGKRFIEESTTPTDSGTLIQRCLHDLVPYTVVTKTKTRSTSNGGDVVLNSGGRVPEPLKARYVIHENKVYVSADAIRQWCHEKRVPIAELTCQGEPSAFVRTRGRMTTESDLYAGLAAGGMGRVTVYMIDTNAVYGANSSDKVVQLHQVSNVEEEGAA